MKKVVVAMDFFKGCLSSSEVEKGGGRRHKARFVRIVKSFRFPIADGGEGILTVLVEATRGTYQKIIANDPLIAPDRNHLWSFG